MDDRTSLPRPPCAFVIVFEIHSHRGAASTDRATPRRGTQHRSGRRGWLLESSERSVTADAVLARAQRADRTRRRDLGNEDRFTVLTANRGSRSGRLRCHGMRRSGYIAISTAPTYEGCSADLDSGIGRNRWIYRLYRADLESEFENVGRTTNRGANSPQSLAPTTRGTDRRRRSPLRRRDRRESPWRSGDEHVAEIEEIGPAAPTGATGVCALRTGGETR